MSLPPQVNTDKSGKHRGAAMKEPVQHSGKVYYGMGPPALESSNPASSSGVYNPEKGPQSVPHYQQAAPVKWMHQDTVQAPGWSQEAPVSNWGQNFDPYMSGVNVRSQMAFHKGVHEAVALPMGGENQLPGPVEAYREAAPAPAQGRGLEWEQHTAAVMHQAQLQAYQQAHKGVELPGQSHVAPHALQGSMLQPFQATFRPSKQQFPSGHYSVFPGNKVVPGLAYSEQPQKQRMLQQMRQQQQQQQQQQMFQQHQLQLQQQQQIQQQQQHQFQQHQIQLQQQKQMQQQYHQQQLQERQQHIQQLQQQQQQQQQMHLSAPQQDTAQLQVQPKQQQNQNLVTFQPPEPRPLDAAAKKEAVKAAEQQEPEAKASDVTSEPDPGPEKVPTNPAEPSNATLAAPRRSRRLSRDGQSPLGPPSTNVWSQASKEPQQSQNGVRAGESQVTTGGVIQITSRRRRASKEINLETLAQKASEMEPANTAKVPQQEDGSPGRQASIVPLVIPVSVPVHRSHTDPQGGPAQGRLVAGERSAGQSERKPSVIVARRRSRRNSMTERESFGQDGDDQSQDEDGKPKLKRRPRPEPLIIPPHKPSTFIPPSLYSTITSYQSNLRSPVRLPDNPLTLPPYTPPPILSPVREGSGLYFSTFLTNIASNQILPPPPTPKSASRSLLRTASSDITPPVLPLITDATPVCLEPRINIGLRYQAEIPELKDQLSSQLDQHKADLVWLPVEESNLKPGDPERVLDLMNMACSSVLRGGGTNQELVLHCLHECGGDFLETLGRLMLQAPVFSTGHHLAGYHYSGSDCWTAEEKRYFNKGISAYRKDFLMVQKLVQTKTVAQCVEFYYTYKKQVKIGRNGILTFGPPDSPGEKHNEAVVDIKSSQQSKLNQGEGDGDDKKTVSYDLESSHQARVAQSLQAHDYAGSMVMIKEQDAVKKDLHHPAASHRPRAEPAAKKPRAPAKPPPDPDAVFPCKKCGRVFYKVKSRSAHMKSHAEQEKKAAALRLKEKEEQAAAESRARKAAVAAAAAAAAHHQRGNGVTEQAEVSSHEDSPEGEDDDDDEDWH
nr:LOW QUALITY PROTEIN: ELM2 and SANT domain-containing protein 1-like [Labrus bergylta]